MQRLSRHWSISRLCGALLLAATAACSAGAVDSSKGTPASPAESAKVLDLATFPLAQGAEEPVVRSAASLSYRAAGTVQDLLAFQRRQLLEQKWKELPGGYVSDQAGSAAFARNGFSVSVMVYSTEKDAPVHVTITNHGNVDLGKLPVPPGTKPFFSGPLNASYITETPVSETSEACRKLLLERGWQPYGTAGDVQFFKQGAVRLAARVSSAPAQGGKTVIDLSAMLMSVDLPAPSVAEGLQYADQTAQLFFDTPATQPEVVDFYQQTLAKSGWESTTEKPIKIDFKHIMIFRNPQQEMLTLELTEVDDQRRVLLKYQSAAEIAELDRLIKEESERKKMAANKPLEKLAIALPPGAADVEQTKTRIEFKIRAGQAQPLAETWRKRFAEEGWQEEVAAFEKMAGSISFSKGQQNVSLSYVDTGILAAEVTLQAHGVELEPSPRQE
jgi:hypothetical protein